MNKRTDNNRKELSKQMILDRYPYVVWLDFAPNMNQIFRPAINLEFIDHVEGNMADGTLESSVSWYEKNLNMHRCTNFFHFIPLYYFCFHQDRFSIASTIFLSTFQYFCFYSNNVVIDFLNISYSSTDFGASTTAMTFHHTPVSIRHLL